MTLRMPWPINKVEEYKQVLTDAANPKQKFGDKKLPIHRVPPAAICAMARGLGEGAAKYGPFNWRDQPVELLTYYGGTMRHLLAWLDGEDVDPDSATGKTHLDGAIASLAILIDAVESGCGIDNRPKPGGAPKMLLEGAALDEDESGGVVAKLWAGGYE